MPPNRSAPKIQTVVTLQGGTGRKERFNGCRAIVEHRKRGGWVALRVKSVPIAPAKKRARLGTTADRVISLFNGEDDGSDPEDGISDWNQFDRAPVVGDTVKWRSNKWNNPKEEVAGVGFPIHELPNDILAKILSFLPLKALVGTSYSLAATNRHLYQEMKNVGASISVVANLLHLPTCVAQFSILHGIATFGFQLRELHCGVCVESNDLPLLMAFFQEGYLKTTKLGLEKLVVKNFYSACSYLQPPSSLLSRVNRSHPMAKFQLNSPVEESSPPNFHTWICESFPNLVYLRTCLTGVSGGGNPRVFANLSKLERLGVSLVGRYGGEEVGDGAPEELKLFVQGLPNLKHLELFAQSTCTGPLWCVASNTLQTINATPMMKGHFFREVICPQLQSFACIPGMKGNGVRPNDPSVFENTDHFLDWSEVQMGDSPWFGMQVPADCVVQYEW